MLGTAAALAACSSEGDGAAPSNDGGALPDAGNAEGGGGTDGGEDLPPVTDACKGDFDEVRGLWKHLSCTGLYADIAKRTIAPAARSYAPALPFWSDGSAKERWLYIPPSTTIDNTNQDKWRFPNETRAWKEFAVGGKVLETRIFYKHADVWTFGAYVWTADGKDAVLNDDGVPNADGVDGGYEIPPRDLCLSCHFKDDSEPLLGVEAVSLGLPEAKGFNLKVLAGQGRLSVPPAKTELTIPDDGKGGAAALGWLHGNCGSSCHSKEGGASFTGLHLRLKASELFAEPLPAITALDAYLTSVDVTAIHPAPVTKRFDFATVADDEARIANSAIVILAGQRTFPADTFQMPPLVSHKVDEVGVGLLKTWVANAQ